MWQTVWVIILVERRRVFVENMGSFCDFFHPLIIKLQAAHPAPIDERRPPRHRQKHHCDIADR